MVSVNVTHKMSHPKCLRHHWSVTNLRRCNVEQFPRILSQEHRRRLSWTTQNADSLWFRQAPPEPCICECRRGCLAQCLLNLCSRHVSPQALHVTYHIYITRLPHQRQLFTVQYNHSSHYADNMLRCVFIVKCGIVHFLCAMRVFDVRASSSSPRLTLCQILFFFMASIAELAHREKSCTQLLNQSLNQSLIHSLTHSHSFTQLIWCPMNWSFRFGTFHTFFTNNTGCSSSTLAQSNTGVHPWAVRHIFVSRNLCYNFKLLQPLHQNNLVKICRSVSKYVTGLIQRLKQKIQGP